MRAGGRRGWPTLELLAIDLKETWRFPIPELLAFLYAFFPLMFGQMVRASGLPAEARLLLGMNSASSLMNFITFILILKNISYGLANEIRKGLVQTYLTYPVGRGRLLLVKVISGILVPVAFVVLSVGVFSAVIVPELALEHVDVLLVGLACMLAGSLLPAALLLFVALLVKRGGTSLGVGIALIFALQITSSLLMLAASLTGWESAWRAYYVLSPFTAYLNYYSVPGSPGSMGQKTVELELWECHAYLASHYAIVIAFYVLAFIYFIRRFEPT